MKRFNLKNKTPDEIQKILADAWLNIYVDENQIFNPLAEIPNQLEDEPHLYITWLMSRPEYFSFVVSELFNIDLLPIQCMILKEMWNRKFPMLIASRGAGKSWLLSIYALLRILFLPKRKVIMCGSAFRQSKIIFEYMAGIWNNSPLLRDIVGTSGQNGPRYMTDMCRFTCKENTITALPIGTGEKIRGQRANDLLIDEFASLSKDIFENVLAGFGAVTSTPRENVQEIAKRKLADLLGVHLETDKEESRLANQIIISGTAYYDFNHFADYWKLWKSIIKTKGDPKKLEKVFDDKEIPSGFNWEQYSIIRIPYELVPEGVMDAGMVARSKATVHAGIYRMEFGACGHPDTFIITDKGVQKLIDIQVGDMVLTHKGRFRKVIKKTFRKYNNKIIKLRTYGSNFDYYFTPCHEFFTGSKFEELYKIEDYTCLPNLQELSNLKILDLRNVCDRFCDRGDFIYAQSSQNKYEYLRKDVLKCLSDGYTQSETARKLGLKFQNVHQIKNDNNKPKGSISPIVSIDYYLGICMGYYASEGCTSSEHRCVEFYLDSHVDKSLQYFIQQLKYSITKAFNLKAKEYIKKDNVSRICITNRLIGEFFSHYCPGNCYDKFVQPELLYSNKEFMKGFIIGFWNGDGHIRDKFGTTQITNIDLCMQIRTVLSYFGIASSFRKIKKPKTGIIKGKKVNLSTAYKIDIHGKDYRKFRKIFYNDDLRVENKRKAWYVKNKNNQSIFKIMKKEMVDYNGYVYNLEVEEDSSYCLPTSAIHNCFDSDSNGFFSRKLIENCVSGPERSDLPFFMSSLTGHSDRRYVFGVDPASEVDKFAIIVLEIHSDHRRIVYSWTTDKAQHREKIKAGMVKETDFYSYCCRKIRDLMKVFPCDAIAIDSQGGGVAVIEGLHDQDKYSKEDGEHPIWEIIEPDKEKDSDGKQGLHIIHKCQFASSDWTAEANNGLRKDFEDQITLFPYFDSGAVALASAQDELGNRVFDTLEDCVMDIEELKDELAMIIITRTPSGRDKWDTPEVKLPGGKKDRLRKDRYSALVMANMVARTIARSPKPVIYASDGGFAARFKNLPKGNDFMGPSWFTNQANELYD